MSILDEDAEKTSRWLATRGRPLEGQLDRMAHHMGEVTGAPLLDGALAGLECRTNAVHDGGDHSIIVGEVVGVTGPAPGDPLIYFGGPYRRLPRNLNPVAPRVAPRLRSPGWEASRSR